MVRSDFASGLVGGRSPGLDDDVFRLWDGLSDFEASESGQAAAWLLEQLAALVGVENVTWAGAVRMDADPEDPLQGWRVARMQALRPPSEAAEGAAPEYAEILGAWDRRKLDPSFLLPMRDVGGFRTYSFRRDLPKAWFSGAFYRTHYAAAGVHDAAFVAFPVNADCESHLGVFSGRPIPEAAIARLALVSRGLKWFHRRLMLSHGLLAASAPLTPAEQTRPAPPAHRGLREGGRRPAGPRRLDSARARAPPLSQVRRPQPGGAHEPVAAPFAGLSRGLTPLQG